MSLRSSVKSSLTVALVSGLAGLVVLLHDVVIASHFATGGAADAYQLAISFPMLAVNVFAGGALMAVLVPLLTRLDVSGHQAEAMALPSRVRHELGRLLLAVCLLWALVYPLLVGKIAHGFSAATQTLSTQLLWLVILVLYFAGLAGVDAAVLNSRRRFVFISTLPAFMPAAVILSVLMLERWLGIYSAAFGLLFGSFMQWLVSRTLTRPLLHHPIGSQDLCPRPPRLVRDYTAAAASAALLAGILLTDTFMASSQPAGSTAAFGYAVRPVIMLLAFVTAVIGNVVLSFFSHLVAIGDWQTLRMQVLFWCSLLAVCSLPIVVLWYFHATDVVALLYQRGAFDPSDTAKVAAVQRIYLLQIPFFLVAVIGWRVMNSLNKHIALLAIATVCFLVNLTTDILLAPSFGLQGIAWGTNLAFFVWAILIACYLLKTRGNAAVLAGATTDDFH